MAGLGGRGAAGFRVGLVGRGSKALGLDGSRVLIVSDTLCGGVGGFGGGLVRHVAITHLRGYVVLN